MDQLLSELEGKSIEEVIASGVSKLASVPSGGGAAAGGGGGAAAAGVTAYCFCSCLSVAYADVGCLRNMRPSTCAYAAKG